MRLPHLFRAAPVAALVALLLAPPVVRADDTEDFLKPDNWEGREDIWKLDPKTKTVVGETKEDPKYNNFFCSKKKYSDFEFSCKVQLRDGVGNSGVQIRSERFDKDSPDNKQPFRVKGPQADIGAGYWGSLYGEGVGGMMKASSPDPIKKAVKDKEFNDYYILAKGTHITIKINGEDDGRSGLPHATRQGREGRAEGRHHRVPDPCRLPEDAGRIQGHHVQRPEQEQVVL